MSEAERKRRQDYKRNRKKWITVQMIAIALIALIAAGSFIIYYQMNRTYYIEYTESGDIDYKVYLKENDFFPEDFVGKDQAYISSLISSIIADFEYELEMDADDVGFDYSYSVTAKMVISDKDSGEALFSPTYELLPSRKASMRGNSLKINEQINVDYVEYNELAKRFIDVYDLRNINSVLLVTMNVDVLSQCDEFEDDSANKYYMSLNIPIAKDTLDIVMTSSVLRDENKVLACSPAINQNIFKVLGIVTASICALLLCILVAFVYITRNEDINYTIKVKRLVSAYRSYIQQMDGEFDTSGYQTVMIKTFTEMLGIRDTIQAPILMSENFDQTKTQFIVPTSTNLVYVFEIKVDNYDMIYLNSDEGTEEENIAAEEDGIILTEDTDKEENAVSADTK